VMDFLIEFSWELLLVLLLVLANGFFVASEFAIVKVRGTQLKPLLKSGDWRVPIAINVTKHLDSYLAATQLGITLSSIALGAWGKPIVAAWIVPLLAPIGITGTVAINSISLALAFAIISFLHIVLGELAPKSLAIQKPKAVTLWAVVPLTLFYYIFIPFIWVMNGTANAMLRLVGIRPATEADHGYSLEELNVVLANSAHVHPGEQLINKLMLKALRTKETTAEQVMLPVEKVSVLWRDKPTHENLALAQKAGYSRFPFCGENIHDVLGVIHVKELLWNYQVLGDQTKLESILHPILTFTKNTKLPAMLELFRKSRNHMAVVVDANQQVLGLVSFEDVLEELVGDIRDEFDIEKGPFYDRTENAVLVDGELPMRDLATEMGWSFLKSEGAETVEKWCLRQWGRRPAAGSELEIGAIKVIAEDTSASGLRRVRFIQTRALDETQEDGA
jgi:CBS domain containing-hemolysin-like protein